MLEYHVQAHSEWRREGTGWIIQDEKGVRVFIDNLTVCRSVYGPRDHYAKVLSTSQALWWLLHWVL